MGQNFLTLKDPILSDAAPPINYIVSTLPTPMFKAWHDDTYFNKLWCFAAHCDVFFGWGGGPHQGFFLHSPAPVLAPHGFFISVVDLSSLQPAPTLAEHVHAGPFQ